jgi:hypothetical protein
MAGLIQGERQDFGPSIVQPSQPFPNLRQSVGIGNAIDRAVADVSKQSKLVFGLQVFDSGVWRYLDEKSLKEVHCETRKIHLSSAMRKV